jgi:hypothetical protein
MEPAFDQAASRQPSLFARLMRMYVGPAQGDGESDESNCHHRGDDNLRWHDVLPFSGSTTMLENHIRVLILIKFGATICGLRL